MKIELQQVLPGEIERRSFEMIGELIGEKPLDPMQEPIIKRVIHTTADFDYLDNLFFSSGAVQAGLAALRGGASVVTDTEMARAGINKRLLAKWGGEAVCFMSDEQVAQSAKENGSTRATAAVDHSLSLACPLIYAFGNAPTGLVRLCELMETRQITPALVIGAPVGFVNVLESKAMLMQTDVPCIVAQGRKGGSGVAAAIVNALLYMLEAEVSAL